MNKRGDFSDPIVFVVVAFATVFILGTLVYIFHQVYAPLSQLGSVGSVNYTLAATQTVGQVDASLGLYRLVTLAILFGYMLSILMTNFLVRSHPAFFGIHVLFTIIAVVLAGYISNSYNEQVLVNPALSTVLGSWNGSNYIMTHLPLFAVLVGILGAILLYSRIPKEAIGYGGLG